MSRFKWCMIKMSDNECHFVLKHSAIFGHFNFQQLNTTFKLEQKIGMNKQDR